MKKHIEELTLFDFELSPIWTWAEENDESLVVPWSYENSIQDHDALFIFATFELSDGSKREGFIAIRTIDFCVYLVSLSNEKGMLRDLPLRSDLRNLITSEDIEKHLGKRLDEVFPLRYYSESLAHKTIEGTVSI